VILADTSVWIGLLRAGDEVLAGLLDTGMVLMHPFVIAELALGSLRQRELVLPRCRGGSEGGLAAVCLAARR
jgi:predicted nucleic acid-binding protein